MEASTDQMCTKTVARYSSAIKPRRCLSCGLEGIKPGRRYCSKKCRQEINWVLSLSKGLLRTFNIRYAAFSFTDDYVILEMLPVWSKEISRFVGERSHGYNPAKDLKKLILQSGREWYHLVHNRNSRSYASFFMLKRNHKKGIDPESIKPCEESRLRLSKRERDCLKVLQLDVKDLASDGHIAKIKSAYKRVAKLYHPDLGGDEEKFKQLNEAHQQMLLWAENPQYTLRRALQGCWSYDGSTNIWSPPL